MKKLSFLLALVLSGAFALTSFTTEARNPTFLDRFNVDKKKDEGVAGAYKFDMAHSSIGFRVKHMGLVDVPGYFRDFSGTINYDAKDVSKSTVEFTAKMTSIDTGVDRRDNHLRSADFFEVEKFPEMTFKSTKVEKKGKQWMVSGDFTMKGVTKQISFPFNVAGFIPGEKGGAKMGVTAETTINRRDYGVNYGGNLPNGAQMLSDNVVVVLQIEANLPAPTAAK